VQHGLTAELTHFLDDSLPVRHTLMRKTHSAAAVENDHGRNSFHTVGAGEFTTEFAEEIQAHHFRLSLEILFYPIHDGLGYEASRSSVREEISDHGLPAFDHLVELAPGLELSCARSQKEEPDPNQQ
jgi:hypothetical protein